MNEWSFVYHPAAFKHHVAADDIEHALKTQVLNETLIEGDAEMAVGFDRAGNPIEVGFRELSDGSLFIFHAMKCQKNWRDKAGISGGNRYD